MAEDGTRYCSQATVERRLLATVLPVFLLRIPTFGHSFLPPQRFTGIATRGGLIGTAGLQSAYRNLMTASQGSELASGHSDRPRGAFIVFEGVDRCGKTTQVQRLVETLKKQNISAEAIRFPNRTTTIGQMINSYLSNMTEMDDHAIHLLFSANRWECLSTIKQQLESGTTLICDRYAFSGVAFSAAKPGMELEWCKECDRGLPAPDAVIFLDIPTDKAKQRGQYGEERYEKEEMQQRVRANFDKVMDDTWHRVNATGTIEEVGDAVAAIALAKVKEARGRPLTYLWSQGQGLRG